MANPTARLKGGLLLFPSTADACIEQAVRARLEERMRDHIRGHPKLTAEQIAGVWAAFAIANAAEASRGKLRAARTFRSPRFGGVFLCAP